MLSRKGCQHTGQAMYILGLLCSSLLTPFAWAGALQKIQGITHYDTIDIVSTALLAPGTGKRLVQFRALAQYFELELELNSAIEEGEITWVGSKKPVTASRTLHYKGKVKGDEHSWVRVSMAGDVMEGMIGHQGDTYLMESAHRYLGKSARGMIMYRLSDSDTGLPPGSCALEDPQMSAAMNRFSGQHSTSAQVLPSSQAVAASGVVGARQELELGVLIDHEFFLVHGSDSANVVQTLLNQVDGIYEAELGVSIRIAQMVIFTQPDDPFSDATDASDLLGEVNGLVSSNASPISGVGLTHLFTGKDLDGNTAGIAFVGVLCSSSVGTGLSADFSVNRRIFTLLTAHELGHNFNAPHDNQAGSACAATPFGFIMNPFLDNSLEFTFSACSQVQIAPEVSAASCLIPIESIPEFTLNLQDSEDPIADTRTLLYTTSIESSGIDSDSVLTLTGQLPPTMDFVNVVASNGLCAEANRLVRCSFSPFQTIARAASPESSIPDNNQVGIRSTITVADVGILSNLRVRVEISHTFRGDLVVTLEPPLGNAIVLERRPNNGNDGQDDINQTFTASTVLALRDLREQSIVGDWTLHVQDLAGQDVGVLNRWSLTFDALVATNITIAATPNAVGLQSFTVDLNLNQVVVASTTETTQVQSAQEIDSDGDGLPDVFEISNGLDPNDAADAVLDRDNDGLSNLQEFRLGTDPNNVDSDSDGVSDGDEVTLGSDPTNVDSCPDVLCGVSGRGWRVILRGNFLTPE